MNTDVITGATEPKRGRTKRAVGLGGATVEALAGLGAVVLSILGLVKMMVIPFTSIAVIATGVALLFEAAAAAAQQSEQFAYGDDSERGVVKAGIGADSIAGLGAITLGILSLIGIRPEILLPISALVLGAGLLLSAGVPVSEETTPSYSTGRADITRQSLRASSGVHVLVGAGAAVLGILGILGNSPYVLTAIAMLSIGAAQLLTGASMGGRMANVLRHQY